MTVAPITGTRGDSVPFDPIIIRWRRTGQTFAKADWSVTAQVRSSSESTDVIHAFAVTLRDSSDDATLAADTLEISLGPIPPATTQNMLGRYVYDVQAVETATGRTKTLLRRPIKIEADVTR